MAASQPYGYGRTALFFDVEPAYGYSDELDAQKTRRPRDQIPTQRTVLSTKLLICTAGFFALRQHCDANRNERKYRDRLTRLVILERVSGVRLARLNLIMKMKRGISPPMEPEARWGILNPDYSSDAFYAATWKMIEQMMTVAKREAKKAPPPASEDRLEVNATAFLMRVVGMVATDIPQKPRAFWHSIVSDMMEDGDPRRMKAQQDLLALWQKGDFSWWKRGESAVEEDRYDLETDKEVGRLADEVFMSNISLGIPATQARYRQQEARVLRGGLQHEGDVRMREARSGSGPG